jgi:hypothetical protein
LEDPEDHEEHADRRQDRPERIERAGRVRRQGVLDPAAEHHDQGDDRGLKDERRAPADRGGDHTADQRPGGGAEPAQPADHAERACAGGQVAEAQRGQDVDRRDQQRGADALEHRVAEDQHPEPRRRRADQGADPVQDESAGEAALAAPAVGQLAGRDHEDGHDQQEQGDRGLHPGHRGVEVVRDVVDHHVHVRAREAADELRERERSQEPPPRKDRLRRWWTAAQAHL